MKKVFLSLMVGVLLLASLATVAMAAPGDVIDPDYLKDLGKAGLAAAHATAKYQNVDKALADGYEEASPCIAIPGLGGMGFHYVNSDLMDPFVDARTPEVLLYVPVDGELKLVAVEYIGFGPQVLFGQTFEDGPFPGSFALHVWLWEENPDGIFANFNPNVSCP